MCSFCTEHSSGNQPTKDMNQPSAPLPSDHKPVTPEFIQDLMDQIDEAEKEENTLWAKRYGSATRTAPVGENTTERNIQWERQLHKLRGKINGLRRQLRDVQMLIVHEKED